MSLTRARRLSSLFRSTIEMTTNPSSTTGDSALIQFITSIDSSSPPTSSSFTKRSITPPAKSSGIHSLLLDAASQSDNSMKKLSAKDISSLLYANALNGSPDTEGTATGNPPGIALKIPWLSNISNSNVSLRRKEVSRERKHKWIFKKSQHNRFQKLIKMCGEKLGTEATIQVFGKLGRHTGLKEYNALIAICVEKARTTDVEEVALHELFKAFQHFKVMKEEGFQLEEGTYAPLLMYFIDMGMEQEFHFFCEHIKDGNPSLHPRLGYYEMLLWLAVNNREKIQEICRYIAAEDDEDNFSLKENYLLALCERGEKNDVLQMLEVIDITKISSVNYVANIFKSLGRLEMESFADNFLLACESSDHGANYISELILSYATCIPNLEVEDAVLKFESMHVKMKMTPSLASYGKLITFCCESLKVDLALDIVDRMCEVGLSLSIDTLNCILRAAEEGYAFNLVRRVYSVICCHNLKPNSETFRSMISMSMKMKDFDGAYSMLDDLKKLNLIPTASIYNAIMAGYFREKNIVAGFRVLKQMDLENVKPDSQTFSYIIGNCDRIEDINKYYEEMKSTGIQVTKHICMALINAYATCGQIDKAKQVMLDKDIPVKNINEIRSVLVSALASNGKMSDALILYEEMKQAGYNLEPKAVIALIENFPLDGELSVLLELLKELHDRDYWVDGCGRIITHCIRNKLLSSTIDLLKQLKNESRDDELVAEVLFDEAFLRIGEAETPDLHFGIDLLRGIKHEMGVMPSRKCLDILLSACVSANDLESALLIWKEYDTAGLPYNNLSYLRMYQVLLASGNLNSAKVLLSKIPQDDPHVRLIIKETRKAFITTSQKVKQRKKK